MGLCQRSVIGRCRALSQCAVLSLAASQRNFTFLASGSRGDLNTNPEANSEPTHGGGGVTADSRQKLSHSKFDNKFVVHILNLLRVLFRVGERVP